MNWHSERECFDTFLRELAYFYVPGPVNPAMHTDVDADGHADADADMSGQAVSGDAHGHADSNDADNAAAEKAEKWQIQHVLFATARRYLVAPKTLLARDVVQVADLPDLYRVFERC